MGVVVLLAISAIVSVVCCVCIYKKRKQSRRFRENTRERRPELHAGVDEPDLATSPRATNASFLRISPPQSSDDISMADLKAYPQRELELSSLYDGIQSDVPIEWRGLNIEGTVAGTCTSSREPSGVFEEVDFGLVPPPPRYDDLEFEDSSEYDKSILASFDSRPIHTESSCNRTEELKFTTIRIGEL